MPPRCRALSDSRQHRPSRTGHSRANLLQYHSVCLADLSVLIAHESIRYVWSEARLEFNIGIRSNLIVSENGGPADNQFDINFNPQRINSFHLQGSAGPFTM